MKRIFTKEHRKKLAMAHIGKKHPHTEKTKEKLRKANPTGPNSPYWKGHYLGVHRFIDKLYKKANVCDFCKKNPGYDKIGRSLIQWANKSWEYLLVRSDWMNLCAKCHKKYDMKPHTSRLKDSRR